jgi:hypothetical protein
VYDIVADSQSQHQQSRGSSQHPNKQQDTTEAAESSSAPLVETQHESANVENQGTPAVTAQSQQDSDPTLPAQAESLSSVQAGQRPTEVQDTLLSVPENTQPENNDELVDDTQGQIQQQDDTSVPPKHIPVVPTPAENQQHSEEDLEQQAALPEPIEAELESGKDQQQNEQDLEKQVDACASQEPIALDPIPTKAQQQGEPGSQQQEDARVLREHITRESAPTDDQQGERALQQPTVASESSERATTPIVVVAPEKNRLDAPPTGTESEQHQIVEAPQSTRGADNNLQAPSQGPAEASLPDHSELPEAAESLFHTQLPLDACYHPVSVHQPAQEVVPPCDSVNTLAVDSEPPSQLEQPSAGPLELGVIETAQASSDLAPQDSQAVIDTLVPSTQPEGQGASIEFLGAGPSRSQSPPTARPRAETRAHSTGASHSAEAPFQRDFALGTSTLQSINQTNPSHEQDAQIVYPNNDLSTQEDTTESIRPSIEKVVHVTGRSTPDSRHDSSQDTPERQSSPPGHSSSPIAQPPDHSLVAPNSYQPSRPISPVLTSSLSEMASPKIGDDFLEKAQREWQEERKKLDFKSEFARILEGAPSSSASARVVHAEGTRSPSTIPDRLPAPVGPSSLRTALTPTEDMNDGESGTLGVDVPVETVRNAAPVEPMIHTTEASVANAISSDNEELSDATDDDNGSLLNDDLQLATEEHIIPLFLEGRQSNEYSSIIDEKSKVLNKFINDPRGTDHLKDVKELLARLRSVETHMDLVYEEAVLATRNDMDVPTQIGFALQFSIDNAIKFRFLHTLFHAMREQAKNIVLVMQDDDDNLFTIIRMFCQANCIRYKMPTKGHQSDAGRNDGNLLVTILPSTSSHVIAPADGIICLDGVQDATQIRQKTWARNPNLDTVPVLHLVISRTVSHIDRYVSSSLDELTRTHTILATLAYMVKAKEVGKPIDEDMMRAPIAAEHVAEWFRSEEKDRSDWPLGPIGSVKSVIEYQTQVSQTPASSLLPSKRPRDDETLDPAKRMRFPSHPQDVLSSSANEIEITRISDSMPGTATDDVSALREQLKRMDVALQQERAERRAREERFREQELMWNDQQTVHENLTRDHRLLLSTYQKSKEEVGKMEQQNKTLRERLETRTKEGHAITNQLDEQRRTDLLSEDAKVAEVSKLRTELAQANAEKDRAEKNRASAEATLDYIKEQYRITQETATTAAATVKDLEAQVEKLSHAASGEPAKLKALHLDQQYKTLANQVKSLKAENSTLKKTLGQKDEELARAKLSGGRMGVGTRATSVTPQPNKVRSRAGSPMMRQLSNLRNG